MRGGVLPGENKRTVCVQEGAAGSSMSPLQVGQCMEKKCMWREHLRSGLLFQGVDASFRYPRPLAPSKGGALCLVVYHAQGHEIDSRKLVYFLCLLLQRRVEWVCVHRAR